MENPFYAITTCIKKVAAEPDHSICHFKGFYNGVKINSLMIVEQKKTCLEVGEEYFLLLEFMSIDEKGTLIAHLIDYENLNNMRMKNSSSI